MPLYEYACGGMHVTELLRSFAQRDKPAKCEHCGKKAKRIPSAHHAEVDGIYSYAPNVGDSNAHERKNEAIRAGTKVIDRGAEG